MDLACRRFDLPAQATAISTHQFARQAGFQILVDEALTRGVRTQAVTGSVEARAGLDLLLGGAGLRIASQDGTIQEVDLAPALHRNQRTGARRSAPRTGSSIRQAATPIDILPFMNLKILRTKANPLAYRP